MKPLADVLVDKAHARVESSAINTPILIAPGVSMMSFVPQQSLSLAEWNFILSRTGPSVHWVECLGQLRSLQAMDLLRSRFIVCAIDDSDQDAVSALRAMVEAEEAWLETECMKFDSDGFLIEEVLCDVQRA